MERRNFDIFECYPDGSKIWREMICGLEHAVRRMHELAASSRNEFSVIDLHANQKIMATSK